MHPFSISPGRHAYRLDFALYALLVTVLAGLAAAGPAELRGTMLALAGAGLLAWPLLEYLLHRWVLHGLRPFSGWHARHHARPGALLITPTLVSLSLIGLLVFAPVMWAANVWLACALTLGLAAGYLGYSLLHHALHHRAAAPGGWLDRRKRWHALHHQHDGTGMCFGVTSPLWDELLASTPNRRANPRV